MEEHLPTQYERDVLYLGLCIQEDQKYLEQLVAHISSLERALALPAARPGNGDRSWLAEYRMKAARVRERIAQNRAALDALRRKA